MHRVAGLTNVSNVSVWGSCFWFCNPLLLLVLLPLRRPRTIFHTHLFVTHNFVTHLFVTHNFCHTPFFTHNFVTHHLSHIQGHPCRCGTLRKRCGTWRHPPPLWWQARHLWHWAGSRGALGRRWSPVAPRRFARQARHLATSVCTLPGRHGTWRHGRSICVAGATLLTLGWLWSPVWVAGAALCVAGVALGDIHLHFAWQAWHLATWTEHLRGRRDASDTGLALVARVGGRRGTLCGRRCTWRHPPALCVAGVALVRMG